MRVTERPSPNFDPRLRPPDMILLHYTGMASAGEALDRLTDPAAKVSAHWLVDEDGALVRLVPEERRAWHAGVASWQGERDVNGISIGIELVNPGHEHGYRDFPAAQIASLIALIEAIRGRWTIPDARLLAHADVAPARREDPGERFPWRDLASAGHGLFVEPPPAPGPALRPGDAGAGVSLLRAGLARLGYGLAPGLAYDAATTATVRAFQRHWVQGPIDGVADGAVRARLIGLLERVR